ncbi:MAG: hypothetical protein HF300_14045 [Ignavibacteria bacterium]|jgi:hypothetical protein|nr:hypothetical protein [Ignavibacteria bacterium]MCU7513681.1 hypothetical protein [Ignavibacteria bacterium]MCU7520656.1 hypothetical protein [Ignavibacteria bacterium]
MKPIILFCFILFCSAVSLAQTNSEILLPEGFSIQPPFNNVSNIGFYNPSFLSRFNGISAGLSYQYGSSIEKSYSGFIGKSLLNGLPYSAALSYQLGGFHIAAAVSQRYNLMLESVNGIDGIINNPDGTNIPVNYRVESDIHDYSLLSSYTISSLPEGNSLSLGFRFSLGVLDYDDHFDSAFLLMTSNYSINSTTFALGADYELAFGKGDLNIGAYFEKGFDFQGTIPIKGLGSEHYEEVQVDVSTPDALRLDFILDLEKVQVMAEMSQIFWHPVLKDYRNNIDFNTGINYKASDMISVFLGAFMTDRRYVNNYYSDLSDNDALFLTLGTDVKLWNYTLGLSVSDSHLLSAETRRQTIARLNLGCQF